MESLAPVLVDGMEPLLDELPPGCQVVVCDPERVRTRAHDLVATSEEFLQASWVSAAAGNTVPIDLQPVLGTASYWTLRPDPRTRCDAGDAVVVGRCRSAPTPSWPTSRPMVRGAGRQPRPACRSRATAATPSARSPTSRAGCATAGGSSSSPRGTGLAKRVVELLGEHDLPGRRRAGRAARRSRAVGVVHAMTGSLGRGFLAPALRLAVLTEADLTGSTGQTSTRDMRKMPSRRRNAIDPLALRPGDFVVHEQHGVGRFLEMAQRTVQGATREYLLIEYAASKRGQPPDQLFVPTDQLDQVTRYVGGEAPTLNKLGGADWAKTKGRARKAVKQIAAELIRLYSARMASPGHAFSAGHPVAARARGRLPLRRDARPAGHHRRGQGRHGAADPDGPAGLRRRRLRQDRDRRPRGVQGGAGRQAGRHARAHDACWCSSTSRPSPSATRRSRRGQAAVALRLRRRGAARSSTAWPTAASTSSSAPTAC